MAEAGSCGMVLTDATEVLITDILMLFMKLSQETKTGYLVLNPKKIQQSCEWVFENGNKLTKVR